METPSQKFKKEKEKLKDQEKLVGPINLGIEYTRHQGNRETARRRKRLEKQVNKYFET